MSDTPAKKPALKTPSMNLPVYWLSLHSAARQLPELAGKQAQERDLQQQNFRKLLEELTDYPVGSWMRFCELSSPTIEGLVAASWCESAHFSHLREFWNALPVEALDLEGKDKQLLSEVKQEVLPKTNLTDLIETGKDVEGVLVLVFMIQENVRQDLPSERFSKLHGDICSALEGRLIFS